MRYRKRGRPRVEHETNDLGTPELQSKRQQYATEEVLDRYLRLSILDAEQHWCGMHFRWLYTKLYGVPSARAHAYSERGRLCLFDDTKLQFYHDEYVEICAELQSIRLFKPIMDVSVFNLDILNKTNYLQTFGEIDDMLNVQNMFINGMNVLVNSWCIDKGYS